MEGFGETWDGMPKGRWDFHTFRPYLLGCFLEGKSVECFVSALILIRRSFFVVFLCLSRGSDPIFEPASQKACFF